MRTSKRNNIFGIRTGYTLESDHNWKYVHQKAFLPILTVGILGLAVFISATWIPFFSTNVVFFAMIALLLITLVGTTFIRRPLP